MLRDRGDIFGSNQTENEGKNLFAALSHVNACFSYSYWDVTHMDPTVIQTAARQNVDNQIQTIRDLYPQLTEENILNPPISLKKLDPIFTVLTRVVSPQVLTGQVWRKFRKTWCDSDLPPNVAMLLQEDDDQKFVQKFGVVQLSQFSNVKLLALQQRGVRDLLSKDGVGR